MVFARSGKNGPTTLFGFSIVQCLAEPSFWFRVASILMAKHGWKNPPPFFPLPSGAFVTRCYNFQALWESSEEEVYSCLWERWEERGKEKERREWWKETAPMWMCVCACVCVNAEEKENISSVFLWNAKRGASERGRNFNDDACEKKKKNFFIFPTHSL